MMQASELDEDVVTLADRLFEGQITDQELVRLNHLLETSDLSLQKYVERLGFHAEIHCESRRLTGTEACELILRDLAITTEVQREKGKRLRAWAISLCLAFICATTSLWVLSFVLLPSPIGSVAGLTMDARTLTSSLELGSVLHSGDTIQVTRGVVTLELPQVVVDVVAPATVNLIASSRIRLGEGIIVARVLGGGEGFSVQTADTLIVDFGTEFLVESSRKNGTSVAVRQGRVQASLLDWRGAPTKVMDLTSSRTATFNRDQQVVREVQYSGSHFALLDETRRGIRRIDGAIRTLEGFPENLESNQLQTPNHMIVLPERLDFTLEEDLVVFDGDSYRRLPRGSKISSYLIHYDPTDNVNMAPRAAVTFFESIAGVLVSSVDLNGTDAVLGNSKTKYEQAKHRELEIDEDEFRISEDRKTISLFWGISPPGYLDQMRIVVVSEN